MNPLFLLRFEANLINVDSGTPLKCYVCEDCYDVSNINETECDVSKPNCQTSYRNGKELRIVATCGPT